MFKKLAVISSLLLSSMYAIGIEHSQEDNTADVHFRIMQRVVYVHNFIRIATNASNADNDSLRSSMNTELKNTFEQMKSTLGYHPLVNFHSIETQQKAENAITAYKNIKQKLFDLIAPQTTM
ncbi:MAG: hypothetical protein ACK4V2_04485 [Pseudomonadota bacterium]|jgi:hypothetical protein|nr:hypothetical protein [Alphaproteobacteria bacterium]